jgi:kinesin family protein 5
MVADVIIEYTVKVSYMEIYMEKIKDLLARELPRLAEGEKLTDSS